MSVESRLASGETASEGLGGSDSQGSGYAAGQPHYELYGWTGIVPLQPRDKMPAVSGYTGRDGKTPTAAKRASWARTHANCNLGLRLPPDVIGIDVDDYGDKHGGATLARLEERLGQLPETWRSSSRPEDPVSGIRLFRVPEGLHWPGGLPGIDMIRVDHRHVTAWPSIHPEGWPYRWYAPGKAEPERSPRLEDLPEPAPGQPRSYVGELPDPAELPELPEKWVAHLTGGEAQQTAEVRGELVGVDAFLTDREPCQAVLKARQRYFRATEDGEARHDSMRDTLLALVRLGEQGHAGTRAAVDDLRAAFLSDVAGEDREAEKEWQRAEDGAVRLVTGKPTPEGDRGCCRPVDDGTGERRPTNMPESFWQSRPVLAHIRDAARAASTSPDAVLGDVLARLASMVSPELRFHTGIGTPASLNLITALVGSSGTGKSSANDVARELLPAPALLHQQDDFRDGLPLGSGEGLVEAYMGFRQQETGEVYKSGSRNGEPKTEQVRVQVRQRVFFYQDEGAGLSKMLERAGATIGTILRSAWGGGLVGQANARTETTRVLHPGTYSLGLVIGYQLGAAQALLSPENVDGGTPQRFLFVSAVDPDAPDDAPEHPGPLDTEAMLCQPTGDDQLAAAPGGKPRTGVILFPEPVRAELRSRRLAGLRGERDDENPLDAQGPVLRGKVAALLALLDGRGQVTEEDWRLSAVVWETSRAIRDRLVEHGREERQREADARDDAAVTRAQRVAVAQAQAHAAVDRVARQLARKVHEKGTQTLGAAKKLTAGRDKPLFQEALDYAVSRDWLAVDEDGRKVSPGTSKPVES
jgi:hypothetical protein